MIMTPKFAKSHDKLMKRYLHSKMKRVLNENRDGIFALKKDGTTFPIHLKVTELINGNVLWQVL